MYIVSVNITREHKKKAEKTINILVNESVVHQSIPITSIKSTEFLSKVINDN